MTTFTSVPNSPDSSTGLLHKDHGLSDDDIQCSSGVKRTVGLFQLVALAFFCVSGGPFGAENGVRVGGPGWVLVGLMISPFIYSLPIGVCTAELASSMPQNGGYILWVARAFGPFWGYMEGYLAWISNVFDNALYPVLFSSYLKYGLSFHGVTISHLADSLIRVSVCIFVMIANILGLQVVGVISVLLAIITLAPFLALSGYAFGDGQVSSSHWFVFESISDWSTFISSVLWLNTGLSQIGSVAGSVKKPKTTYSRGIFLSIFLIMLVNIIPVLVAVSVDTDYKSYDAEDSFWAELGGMVGGPGMRYSIIISALVTNLAMLNSLMATTSWNLYALCLPDFLHIEWLAKVHPTLLTPYASIIFNSAFAAGLCLLPFQTLMAIDVITNTLGVNLQCAALLSLRRKQPDMVRPYRIPLSFTPLFIFLLPQFGVGFFILYVGSWMERGITVAALALGVSAWYVRRIGDDFDPPTLAELKESLMTVEDPELILEIEEEKEKDEEGEDELESVIGEVADSPY